ncbi:MAG: hypothetical protein GY832_15345 [Chloroflexi bacterium]|nr:hypothetical protein [Chloroflexota bacterium]
MSYVNRIIDIHFEGKLTNLSKFLGHKNPTTVQGWKERGSIPDKQQKSLLTKAQAAGIAVTPNDFFDLPDQDSTA